MHRLLVCYLDVEDAARIDHLWFRLLQELRMSGTGLPRSAVLRALTHRGLALGERQRLQPSSLREGRPLKVEYQISVEDFDRLEQLALRREGGVIPALASVQRAIVALGLEAAEQDATFAQAALAARLARRRDSAA